MAGQELRGVPHEPGPQTGSAGQFWNQPAAPAPLTRTSPCVRKLAMRAPFTAFSKEQSEKMIRGDLPPSSSVTGLIPLAAISMI